LLSGWPPSPIGLDNKDYPFFVAVDSGVRPEKPSRQVDLDELEKLL
jgi:hypothetical protein